MAKTNLTAERLKELLHYDPETGIFTWIKRTSNRVCIGSTAGTPHIHDKRLSTGIDGRVIRNSHLAWLYMTGNLPENIIDHIDGDPTNDRFCNLRDVTQGINVQNIRKPPINNTSGFLGVTKHLEKWRAKIRHKGKCLHLGLFLTPEEAHAAYVEAKRRLHPGCTI